MRGICFAALVLLFSKSWAQDQNINGNVYAGVGGTYWQGFRSNAPTRIWGFQQSDRMMVGMGGDVYDRGFSTYSMGIFNGSTTKEDVYLYNQNSPTGDFLVLKNNGNVGIGITNPPFSLTLNNNKTLSFNPDPTNPFGIEGGDNAQTRLIMGAASGNGSNIAFGVSNGNGYSGFNEKMRITSTGDVGIGTTTPTHGLQIANTGVDLQLTLGSTAVNRDISMDMVSGTTTAEVLRFQSGHKLLHGVGAAISKQSFYNNSAEVMTITSGNVGIGTTQPDAKLTVKGKIHAEEVKVDLSVPGPDYVFEKDYKLKSLQEVESYVNNNKHLPEIPSAKAMEKDGVSMGEMQMNLLKKIEELTLYIIQLNKKQEQQEAEISKLKNK